MTKITISLQIALDSMTNQLPFSYDEATPVSYPLKNPEEDEEDNRK